MKKVQSVIGIIFLVLGIAISLFVSDIRAFYSGGFFIVLGIFLLFRSRRKTETEKVDES